MTTIGGGDGAQEITLRSGDRVLVRPIRPDDKQRLLEGFERLGPESRYLRFFSAMPKLRDRELHYLTEVDHHAHEALIALEPGTDETLGVARFIRSSDDATAAEVAVAVVDRWQGRGLGTVLLDELARRAREEGIERFTAFVLARNQTMLDVLRRLGDTHVTGHENGVFELVMNLPAEGIPESLRHTVRAAAQGELQHDARQPGGDR